MPMQKDEHENLLARLLEEDVTHTERLDILSKLRLDYDDVLKDFSGLNESVEKLKTENQDLLTSNSRLFRQLGTPADTTNEQQNQKSVSETIRVSELLKGVGM